MTEIIKKGDYVSPIGLYGQDEIGIVERVRRTRSPQSRNLVVKWLTHTGSSYEFSCGLKNLDPTDSLVATLKGKTDGQ